MGQMFYIDQLRIPSFPIGLVKTESVQRSPYILFRDHHTLQTSGKYPCAVCRKGVGKKSIFCSVCSFGFAKIVLISQVELPTIKRCCSAWGKFRELLCFLTCKAISLNTRCQMYNSCVIGMMLCSSEYSALTQEKKHLEHRESNALMDVQHQERTVCQHKFPPESGETEKPGFGVKV